MQVRAMQIIDELEKNKRGPYGGGMGYVAYNGNMDIALALRTMVIPNPPPPIHNSSPSTKDSDSGNGSSSLGRKEWTVHLQVCSLKCPASAGSCFSLSWRGLSWLKCC